MRLSKKIAMLSAATLLAVAPVVATGVNNVSVQAASSSKVYQTNGKGSVVVTKKTNFYNKDGKKLSRTAAKGGKYTIWDVKTINGKVYFSIQTNLQYWLPAVATKGTVTYKDGASTVTYKTNGTSKVKVSQTKAKKSSTKKTTTKKAATKKTSKKSTSKKPQSKTSTAIKSVKITMKRKAYVYDKNGKRVKNYYGTSYIAKGVTVKGLGTKTIKGTKYYALEPGKYYVKVSDVK
ncbi:hypothetical protein J2Z60_000495 [Lactobacillus colini]|uniref:S-layer protein C-terminal domain-containing protein n=1 Tax=Lactobacillus colini TaxID=1819254 RepID=A0ABS4MDC2_9LACO|nr:SLAP domain-containing protein [Lactobacillus colini]MBP2057331.1 hypothetical protein [Lactobacillus colini]